MSLCQNVLRSGRLQAQGGLRRMSTVRTGETLHGKYELVSELARGNTSESAVWLAKHQPLSQSERYVAVKIAPKPAVQAAAEHVHQTSGFGYLEDTKLA